MAPSTFLVVSNAEAGSNDREATEAAVDVLRAAGAAVEAKATEDPAELTGVLSDCGGRTVVVAGGDGSVHEMVGALEELEMLGDAPVGLVPLGTGNDLARSAGIPLDPVEAAQLLLATDARLTDLVACEPGDLGPIVNASHAGLGAEASATSADLKPKLGKAAYPVGALVAAVREEGWRLTVQVDGRTLHDGWEPVLLAGVGNGRTIGGGTPLFPQAVLDDGLLDVVVAYAVSAHARVAFAAALRAGDHLDRDDVVADRGQRVEIAGEPTRHSADGEISEELSPVTYEVRAGAWRLVRPTSAPAADG